MLHSKKLIKSALLLALGAAIAVPFGNAQAKSIRSTNGEMPAVYWTNLTAFPYINNIGTLKNLYSQYVTPAEMQEAGTLADYDVTASENSNLVRGIEIYNDVAAYKTHTNSTTYYKYLTERIPITQSSIEKQVTPLTLESKASGTATSVFTSDVTVNTTQVNKYNQLTEAEMMRAVDNESGVLAAFSVADPIYPNQIHNMYLFTDANAQSEYFSSSDYQNYRAQVKSGNMIQTENVLYNQPANISLSGKGLHEHSKSTVSKDTKKSKKEKKAKTVKTKKVETPKVTNTKTVTTPKTTTTVTTPKTTTTVTPRTTSTEVTPVNGTEPGEFIPVHFHI